MGQIHWPLRRIIVLGAAAMLMMTVLFGAACGGDSEESVAVTSDTPAAQLRSLLTRILSEHVFLAADATSHALGGRQAEFEAAAAALDGNSVELAQVMGSIYGPEAEQAFLDGWREHIGFFVSYTTGVATGDEAMQAQAIADLEQYGRDLAALLHSAAGLDEAAVVALVKTHHEGLARMIHAQAAGDAVTAYEELREAAEHMHMFADPLAEAVVQQFPGRFEATAAGAEG